MISNINIYYPRAMVGNGGPTAAVWMWAESLLKAGANVKVFYDSSLKAEQALYVHGIDVVPIVHQGRGRWRRPKNLEEIEFEENSLVFLHSAFLAGNLFVARHARRQGGHTVFVPHGAYERAARRRSAILKRLWLLWEKRELARAIAIHAFVDTEREPINEVARHTPVVVAPTPIEIPKVSWTGGGGYIAWFGRYDIEHKGLDILIRSYAEVDPKLRLPLKLRGRDSTDGRQSVIEIVKKYRMETWISVGPEINGDEKIEFLRKSELFLMPSRWESFSIALIEVLSLGVPCLISDQMPISRQLENETGAAVSSISGNEFGQVLASILSGNHETFKKIAPRVFVENNLSSQVVGKNLLEQLEAALRCRK